ncbi:unnamed protein product [Musa banksii]
MKDKKDKEWNRSWNGKSPRAKTKRYACGGLREACATDNYKYGLVAFVNQFGGNQDLAGHCDPNTNDSTFLSNDIILCQRDYNVKVMLSLGGAIGKYRLVSKEEAREVAHYIWNNFLVGSSSNRPLGNAVLDEVDFDIEGGSRDHWDDLPRCLKAYSTPERKVYLSATPQCPMPDYFLQPAIDTGLFDYLWVQFYNNYCRYSGNVATFEQIWNRWTSMNVSKVFLGVPASHQAAGGGFVRPAELITQVLPIVKRSEKYGGIMLWNRYHNVLYGYSSEVKNYVCSDRLSSSLSMLVRPFMVV